MDEEGLRYRSRSPKTKDVQVEVQTNIFQELAPPPQIVPQ